MHFIKNLIQFNMPWYEHTTVKKTKTTKDLWVKCEKCNSYVYKNELKINLEVCPDCNYHGSIT